MLVGPKIAFSVGGGGELLVVGSKVAFFHIMRLLLIYWCSLCIIIARI